MSRNVDYPWDDFDSDWYIEHNYRTIREEDLRLVAAVRDFLASECVPESAVGVDVGSGPSVIPALAMLPYCKRITLWEPSASNRRRLTQEIRSYGQNWDAVWDELAVGLAYRDVTDPRRALAEKAVVQPGSVFELPPRRWQLGTMFFVAESLTSVVGEFASAVTRFLAALKPGAPFAIACMEGSAGYAVADLVYPAVAISATDLERCLASRSARLVIRRFSPIGEPLRTGYTGTLLATGLIRV